MDIDKVAAAAFATMLAAGTWVLRTVLTNNRRVELLEQAIKLRAEASQKADQATAEALRDLSKDLKEVTHKLAVMEGEHNAN